FTLTPTNTFTPTFTPTKTNTPIGGMVPAASTLPVVSHWLSAAARGLLAMAPPPPPPVAGSCTPCQGLVNAPASANSLYCPQDPGNPSDGYGSFLVAYEDSACTLKPRPLDHDYRGFDDPQADPNMALVNKANGCSLCATVVNIDYQRADLYNLPPKFRSNFP